MHVFLSQFERIKFLNLRPRSYDLNVPSVGEKRFKGNANVCQTPLGFYTEHDLGWVNLLL